MFLDRHNEGLDVPDDLLAQVFDILEEQLTVASGLLGDIETVHFQTPSCYPDREVDGSERISETLDDRIIYSMIARALQNSLYHRHFFLQHVWQPYALFRDVRQTYVFYHQQWKLCPLGSQ